MKKDLDWLVQRIHSEREQLAQSFAGGKETFDESAFNDGKDKALSSVLRLIDQLDEPETLSEYWIEQKSIDTHVDTLSGEVQMTFRLDDLQNLLVPKQEGITHKQVEKYLLDKNIRVIDIDIYEEMQSELEELKNGTTLSKTETVADGRADFFKSLERLKEVMSMEVEELEE